MICPHAILYSFWRWTSLSEAFSFSAFVPAIFFSLEWILFSLLYYLSAIPHPQIQVLPPYSLPAHFSGSLGLFTPLVPMITGQFALSFTYRRVCFKLRYNLHTLSPSERIQFSGFQFIHKVTQLPPLLSLEHFITPKKATLYLFLVLLCCHLDTGNHWFTFYLCRFACSRHFM